MNKDEHLELHRGTCVRCATTGVELAPSQRCMGCETAIDTPTASGREGLRQIGDVAEMVGLSLRSVRHYEDEGLVRPAGRTPGGFRLYDDDAITRLQLIMQMKPLGFTLHEMRLLIEARAELQDGVVEEPRASELRDRLSIYAELAQDRVVQLREQLAVARAFAKVLIEEAAQHQRPEH